MNNYNTEEQPQLFTYPQLHAWLHPLSAFVSLLVDMNKYDTKLKHTADALQQWLANATPPAEAPDSDWCIELRLYHEDVWDGRPTPPGIYNRWWFVSFTKHHISITAESEDDETTGYPSDDALYYNAYFSPHNEPQGMYAGFMTGPISVFVEDVLRCKEYCTPKMQHFEADIRFR
jgi:hypothetical protein